MKLADLLTRFKHHPSDENLAKIIKALIKYQTNFPDVPDLSDEEQEQIKKINVLQDLLPEEITDYADRFLKMIEAIKTNPKIQVLGTWDHHKNSDSEFSMLRLKDPDGNGAYLIFNHSKIRWEIKDMGLQRSEIIHDWFGELPCEQVNLP